MRYLVCMFLACLCAAWALGAAPMADFTLRDFIGRDWRNECVTFPLTADQLRQAQLGLSLTGPDGKAIPYQVAAGAGQQPATISFLTDLNAYETRVFRFTTEHAQTATDLRIVETPADIRLTNSLSGITIAKALANGAGPIAGIRLKSGKWVGASTLTSDTPLTAYTAEVTARGPAFVEVVCRATFNAKQTWELRVRLQANEPVVLVDETFTALTKADFTLSLSPNFAPDTLFYRYGKGMPDGNIGKMATWKIAPGEVFVLEPWLRWWERDRQGACFSVYNEKEPDLLSIAAGEAGVWIDPAIPSEQRAPVQLVCRQEGQDLRLTFPLKTGRRQWMISALDKDAALTPLLSKTDLYQSPLPYQSLIKHGHFPLDTIKDYTLTWPDEKTRFPHLILTQADVTALRARTPDPKVYDSAIASYLRNKQPLGQFNMEGPITAYLATGNVELGQFLLDSVQTKLHDCIDIFMQQQGLPYGAAPHNSQVILDTIQLADIVLSNPRLTPEQRERLLAQLAFIGYTINRPEYWSLPRGYAANPNMTTTVYGYITAIACELPGHPLAKQWVQDGITELKRQLDEWSDSNGGWLEAPHYAMVSFDQILGGFMMARNAGFADYLYDPKVKLIGDWFGKISTPPDSRLKGSRHFPPVGNTYLSEPSGEFGTLAYLWKDRDPEFAARMQWMYHQHQSYPLPGIGSGYPGLAGFRGLLLDPTLPEKAPAWGSELFPQTGVVLRSGFPSARETMLYLIAGNNHAHYDNDSGSITLWAKGRILADDFGYYGMAPANDHSMVESTVMGRVMAVKQFTTDKYLDYVSGESGGWTRQIAFVKDPDPLAPNYFMINDSFQAPTPATWRLWCTARAVTPGAQFALVEGKEDVDMGVFFTRPTPLALSTEEKTRTAGAGLRPDGSQQGRMDSTQIGIIATLKADAGLTAILYPYLKTEQMPFVTPIADGRGVKMEHGAGTDYVFLSATPFTYAQGDISFTGTCGAIRLRGNGAPALSLGAPGRIAARGKVLQSGEAVTPPPATPVDNGNAPQPAKVVPSANQVPNGDFETGQLDIFTPGTNQYGVTTTLYKGNPAGKMPHSGQYCVEMIPAANVSSGSSTSLSLPFVIDPKKIYRLSFQIYTGTKAIAVIGGYASDSKNNQLSPNGKPGVWQYRLEKRGPTKGWETLTTTIGPAGTKALFTWPSTTERTGMTIWFKGHGKVYIDNIVFKEVKTP